MKLLLKAGTYILLVTIFIACKKGKSNPEPEPEPEPEQSQMWYRDKCKIQSFAYFGLNYLVDYNAEGYPGKVSLQHDSLKTVYELKYQQDKLTEIIQIDNNKGTQKIKYVYDEKKLLSVHWFDIKANAGASSADTLEVKWLGIKYDSSDRLAASTLFLRENSNSQKWVSRDEDEYTYDEAGNVSNIKFLAYIGDRPNLAGFIEMHYDDKPVTGKFLNLLFFNIGYNSLPILF